MPLHLIGLGLSDEQDITLKGLAALRKCKEIYLEAYTSILTVPVDRLEKAYGVTITVADREFVESGIEPVLERAQSVDIALLVVGDPFGATTHCDLLARAKQLGVAVNVVHNASIMNAIGACGLQLYRFGETVSIPYFTSGWRPDSFFDKLIANRAQGLHTLALLDIKARCGGMNTLSFGSARACAESVALSGLHGPADAFGVEVCGALTVNHFPATASATQRDLPGSLLGSNPYFDVREPTLESLARGKREYLSPRFMSVRQAVTQLLEVDAARADADGRRPLGTHARAIGLARIGCATQLQVVGTLEELLTVDFGDPLHSLVLLGETCGVEDDLVSTFCLSASEAPQLDAAALTKLDAASARAAAAHEGRAVPLSDDDDEHDAETQAEKEERSMFSSCTCRDTTPTVEPEVASLEDMMGAFGM